jgi:hypothetical protein
MRAAAILKGLCEVPLRLDLYDANFGQIIKRVGTTSRDDQIVKLCAQRRELFVCGPATGRERARGEESRLLFEPAAKGGIAK